MTYFNKNNELKKGYNVYIDDTTNRHNTMMNIGLLLLDNGDEWEYKKEFKDISAKEEIAVLLFEGEVDFIYNGKTVHADRPDSFNYEGYCLLAPKNTDIKIKAYKHSELYIQTTVNDKVYEPIIYNKDNMLLQKAGSNGELMGCMRRDILTYFDYDNAPFSNMVLGEVLSYPGKWSSYPPHYHPQPEVYFYRFDKEQGFGAGFANDETFKIEHNGLSVINYGFHSQVTAPGYALCYAWGIRHLEGNPWKKTRIDEKRHDWLLKVDANDHIFKGREK